MVCTMGRLYPDQNSILSARNNSSNWSNYFGNWNTHGWLQSTFSSFETYQIPEESDFVILNQLTIKQIT